MCSRTTKGGRSGLDSSYYGQTTARGEAGNGCEFAACRFLWWAGQKGQWRGGRRCKLACAHDPVAILARAHALAGLFKLEVLEELNAVRKGGILFETALPLAHKPFWEGPGYVCAGDGVYRHSRVVCDFHGGDGMDFGAVVSTSAVIWGIKSSRVGSAHRGLNPVAAPLRPNFCR